MTTDLANTDVDDGKGWGDRRCKVVSWHDPAPTTAMGLSMPGIDYLRAIVDGTLPPPPIGGLMQLAITSAEPGRVVFTGLSDESAYHPIGAIHGGLAARCWTPSSDAPSTARCRRARAIPPSRSR